MKSEVKEFIKTELQNARVYSEGQGIRIDVKDSEALPDIMELIQIKLAK